MEYRIKDYQIDGNSIVLPKATSIEDIRLIYNETQKVLICSTAKKDNLSGLGVIIVNQFNNTTTINVPTSICVLQPNDLLTIKCDYGDEGATETTLNSAKEEILTAVEDVKGATAKEDTLISGIGDILEEVSKVSDKESDIDQLLAIQLQTIIGE